MLTKEQIGCAVVVCIPLFCILANVFIWMFYIFFGLIYIPYLLWMILVDRDTPQQGGRDFQFIQRLPPMKWFKQYFNASIIQETELNNDKNYFFIVYPHGLISMGSWCNFVATAKIRIATLNSNFFVPIFRELLLFAGFISCNKKSITHTLKYCKTSVVLIAGGAEEALHTNKGIVLDKRKGFVEIALKTGTPLVPVYTFGERKLYTIYDQQQDSFLWYLQQKLKGIFGCTIPIFWGNRAWLFPKQETLTTVIGTPIEIKQIDNPTTNQIDELHKTFRQALLDLHEKYRKHLHSDEPKLNVVF